MRVLTVAVVAALIALAVFSIPVTAEFDPVAGPYPYEQPDATGDVFPHSTVAWADITSFSIGQMDDGSIVFRMKFVDLAMATGDLRFCTFFKVDGTTYQAGYRGQVVNGAANGAATSCTWGSSGTTVGTPTLDTANDQIRIVIAPDAIPDLLGGTQFTGISVLIGGVVPVANQGVQDLYDDLTPSIQPVDFTYSAGGAESEMESFLVTATAESVEVAPGGNAAYALQLTNNGTSVANYTFAADLLPPGYPAAFDPSNGSVEGAATVNVTLTVSVPTDAAPGPVTFSVNVSGPNAGNASLPLVLIVIEPSDAPPAEPTQQTSTAANETGEPHADEGGGGVPAPGFALLAVTLAAAVFISRRRRA